MEKMGLLLSTICSLSLPCHLDNFSQPLAFRILKSGLSSGSIPHILGGHALGPPQNSSELCSRSRRKKQDFECQQLGSHPVWEKRCQPPLLANIPDLYKSFSGSPSTPVDVLLSLRLLVMSKSHAADISTFSKPCRGVSCTSFWHLAFGGLNPQGEDLSWCAKNRTSPMSHHRI